MGYDTKLLFNKINFIYRTQVHLAIIMNSLTLTGGTSGVQAKVINVSAPDGTDPNTFYQIS